MMDKHEIARYMIEIDEQDMMDILQEVFENRSPYPTTEPENRYFLGFAVRAMEDEYPTPEKPDPDFKEWDIIATAYPDREKHPLGVYGGFAQFGLCKNCGFEVSCTAKTGFCSICGHKVHLG